MKYIISAVNFLCINLGILIWLTQKLVEYSKVMLSNILNMFSIPSIIKKINKVNYQGYMK